MNIRSAFVFAAVSTLVGSSFLDADGLVRPPANYQGSLEERAQEAIIVFREGTDKKSAVEDLILKIRVEGTAENFAWILPLPNPPKTTKEDPKLFEELHRYVEVRTSPRSLKKKGKTGGLDQKNAVPRDTIEVISREVVGSYDVAVVRENQPGVLNGWLKREGFQPLPGGQKLIESYRRKNYVFACVKVREVTFSKKKSPDADLHPLRFTFETGGRDGIYFPMRITGLQTKPFDINLYVFYRAWLNDRLNEFGYRHQGFSLKHRDWDTAACKPNAGKSWSKPDSDPYLKGMRHTIPTVVRFFKKHHSAQRFYLTNLQAWNLKPAKVRRATNDLWLFPYYTDRSFVPYDKRDGGPAVD